MNLLQIPAFFWISRIILTFMSGFFLFWGISIMLACYKLENPGYFIMTFFAASLIILISATLLLGFVLAMIRRAKGSDKPQNTD